MINQAEGIIFTNDDRLSWQSNGFRSKAALHNVTLPDEFNTLLMINDCTLTPDHSNTLLYNQRCHVIFIPLVGSVKIHDRWIEPGEVYFNLINAGEKLELTNPYKQEGINFIEIRLIADDFHDASNYIRKIHLHNHENSLVTLGSVSTTKICIGKFDSRVEKELGLPKNRALFAMNICGSFEVQGRLLFERDAVALWNCERVEFESLMDESIVLMIEP